MSSVFAIDDNWSSRKLVQGLLSEAGHPVRTYRCVVDGARRLVPHDAAGFNQTLAGLAETHLVNCALRRSSPPREAKPRADRCVRDRRDSPV